MKYTNSNNKVSLSTVHIYHKVSHVQYHLDSLERGNCTQHAELVVDGHCSREALRVDHVRVQACKTTRRTLALDTLLEYSTACGLLELFVFCRAFKLCQMPRNSIRTFQVIIRRLTMSTSQ